MSAVERRLSMLSSKLSIFLRRFSVTASKTANLNIGGIYPPIATPFDPSENIDYGKLNENLKVWEAIPFRGYVVQGSNAETAYLKLDEKVNIVKHVRENVPSEKLVIAGSGCESTKETVESCQRMSEVGADAVLVRNPCFYKGSMTDKALIQHYRTVADNCDIPVILYSVPANTGLELPENVIVELSSHQNIIGLKDSGGDITKLAGLAFRTSKNNFQLLAGSASFLLPSYVVGCVGGVCALANILGQACCDLEKLFKEGKFEEAKLLQQRLVAPNQAITKRFGIAGLKSGMDMFGLYGGPTRTPILPLENSQIELLREAFKNSNFI
ncbi:DgyrCDS8769 [Dimorphilus gyrociliatus]|uniref:4-hydroxy-2-oxoglutarate aldolase, mitochondrial n=1 Tax=Dimorphilus gyrociliatus TaxID=2664684 RepID=A0A7I8VWV5_9ANNE|nr:DgyrCDS8769 [Dimorphilus gyrociliatus]